MSAPAPSVRVTLALALGLLGLSACGAPKDDAAPRAALDQFRAAVQNGDREQVRDLLTTGSAPAVDELLASPRTDADTGSVATGSARSSGRFDFEVRDASGARGVIVVVRESGRWRVDLIESAVASGGVTTGAGFEIVRGAREDDVREAIVRRGELNR